MIRVAHVVVAGEVGGAERMLAALAAPRSMPGVEHVALVVSPDPRVPSLLRACGVSVEARGAAEGPVAFVRHAFGSRLAAWIAGWIRGERADLAHVHTFASQVVGTRAALAAGVPIVRTEHSTRAFTDGSCWPFARWSLARASASVAVSRHVRDTALARAPWASARMRVVANGVDLDHFCPSAPPAGALLRLGLVGRLEPRKGLDLAAEVIARTHDVSLDVIGDGPSRDRFERLVRRRGLAHRVRLLGYHADVRPAVSACDAVLCTARTEGLGLALLEAMAMQRPIVGFAVGGVAEIADGPLAGLLVAAGDVDRLAELVQGVAAARAHLGDLGRAARARVAERFTLAGMTEGYRRVYADVLAGTTMAGP
jgi:L-malate glycosyltransferase